MLDKKVNLAYGSAIIFDKHLVECCSSFANILRYPNQHSLASAHLPLTALCPSPYREQLDNDISLLLQGYELYNSHIFKFNGYAKQIVAAAVVYKKTLWRNKPAVELMVLDVTGDKTSLEPVFQEMVEQATQITSKLLIMQEEEKKRVARELHDDLSQRLAAIAIDVGALQLSMQNQQYSSKLQQIKKALVGISEDTHRLSRSLHPSILDDLGLVEALRSEFDNYQRREDIKIDFSCPSLSLGISKNVELVIFRVVQEALRNAAKYSEASKIDVKLSKLAKQLILSIEDNGMGFDEEIDSTHKEHGLGLTSMMERARAIKAKLNIESEVNKGVRIELQIPLT